MTALAMVEQRRWGSGERMFGWFCAILFVEVFCFFATLEYLRNRPQFVDLPDLDLITSREKKTYVEADRSWLREGEWQWPLGGDMMVLPQSLALERPPVAIKVPPNVPPLIFYWWSLFLGVEDTLLPPARRIIAPDLRVRSEGEAAWRLIEALEDFGPLWVRLRERKTEHLMLGHYESQGRHMFLLRFDSRDGTEYGFVRPAAIDLALAWPHPMRASCKPLEGQWVRLIVQDPLGRPLRIDPSKQIRLPVDGMIRPTDEPGIYDIRFAGKTNLRKQEIHLRQSYFMPPTRDRWVRVRVSD